MAWRTTVDVDRGHRPNMMPILSTFRNPIFWTSLKRLGKRLENCIELKEDYLFASCNIFMHSSFFPEEFISYKINFT